ncbi:MAG: alkaline phosphatase D family protein [Bacteroidetes bacterium]|jgi:alkaline phosphatase D|nr:alkaline phosphatase D family protein [Bacteroidota bacterium]MDA0936142.1 alkaline phosphatase D family protein [Bacteroidota bacterium]
MSIKHLARQLSILVFSILFSCQSTMDGNGPHFANGIKNGWADQNSIVLWTRLTQDKLAHFKGEPFIEIPVGKMKSLAENQDLEGIYNTQIPDGLSLKDMEGYCPGSEGQVLLKYHKYGDSANEKTVDWRSVDPQKDFTHQWKLEGLEAGEKYSLKIYARANKGAQISDSISGSFLLPADRQTKRDVKFCVVSCHDYNRRDDLENGHKIYPSMAQLQPDFYVHTGDVEYMDKPTPYAMTEELMRFKWNRLFALPFQRSFYNHHTSYFMKDDHDVGFDDSYPGRDYGMVSFERGLEIFDLEQFPSHPKRYKTIRWGKDLQIWIVEGRNYRNQNYLEDGPEKTIWGTDQKQWFYNTVTESDATYKVLITSSPILGPDRVKKNDNLSNATYSYEQTEILDFIKKQKNLFIVNGDRHWQYVTHFENTNLWEFGCGAGADVHAGGWKQEDFRPEHQFLRVKGGFLSVSLTTEKQAAIKFIHHDVAGNPVNEVSF